MASLSAHAGKEKKERPHSGGLWAASVSQMSSAFRSAAGKNLTAVCRGHSLSETVLLFSLELLRLIRSQHIQHPPFGLERHTKYSTLPYRSIISYPFRSVNSFLQEEKQPPHAVLAECCFKNKRCRFGISCSLPAAKRILLWMGMWPAQNGKTLFFAAFKKYFYFLKKILFSFCFAAKIKI